MCLGLRTVVASFAAMAVAGAAHAQTMKYPPFPKSDQVDVLHGVSVADPYRAMEEMTSAEVRAWITAQNKLTQDYLSSIPERKALVAKLRSMWNYERQSAPIVRAGLYFYTRNTGLQNQSVLYVKRGPNGTPRVLLDPNTLSADGTVALGSWTISDDGKLMAYSLARAGSDWREWRVRNVTTGKDLPDVLKWSKFSGASWSKDGKGFYYSRYDEPKPGQQLAEQNYYQKLYYHRLGTPQSQDRLIYERKDQKEWGFDGQVTDDGRYLIIHVWEGTHPENRLFYLPLSRPNAKVVELLPAGDAEYLFLGNVGSTFYLLTNKNAGFRRIIAIDATRPGQNSWRTIIPATQQNLESATMVGGTIFATYLKDAASDVRMFDYQGKPKGALALPGIGSVSGFDGRMSDRETFYVFTSFTVPPRIYRYDIRTARSSDYWAPKVNFDTQRYETKQVFYTSEDGTRVPMFITGRKGIPLNGENPTLLYGYGGFRASMTPYFSVINMLWMEMGGVYAVACIRGGLEYGEKWYRNAIKDKRKNAHTDFIAAAEWLIENRVTSTPKLAINGGSNGGLLVGAVLNRRPDLFGAAVPAVGVMDMLRFHKFTIGWAWVSDYGSPDNEADFKSLLEYSPYHNIRSDVKYPAVLVTTADTDDRVVPAHSYKYAARLQELQADNPNPMLIRVETSAGHGAGTPISKIVDEYADVYAFLVKALNMKLPEGF
ncbi:MAG: prolyl oligopeptidase family serine peptidase [Fimbriimonadaceae bacterium]